MLAESPHVGWGLVGLYTPAYTGTSLLFLAPLLVSLALKVNDLVGLHAAPGRLALVTSVGSLLSVVANPFFGGLSDRTSSPRGMRRPWMVAGLAGGSLGILAVALAPTSRSSPRLVHSAGLLQRPARRAGRRHARPGPCCPTWRAVRDPGGLPPVASVVGTFLVQLFDQNVLAMLLVPCAVGVFLTLLFVARLADRRLDPGQAPARSVREVLSTFYVNIQARA